MDNKTNNPVAVEERLLDEVENFLADFTEGKKSLIDGVVYIEFDDSVKAIIKSKEHLPVVEDGKIQKAIEFCKEKIKDYDSKSENTESAMTATYYSGKANVVNDVKIFLESQPTLLEEQPLKEDELWEDVLHITDDPKRAFDDEETITKLKKQFSIKKL